MSANEIKLTGKADPLWHRDVDPGYRIGWRSKLDFAKGHIEGEMTYGAARARAAELAASDPSKTYFPEPILTETRI